MIPLSDVPDDQELTLTLPAADVRRLLAALKHQTDSVKRNDELRADNGIGKLLREGLRNNESCLARVTNEYEAHCKRAERGGHPMRPLAVTEDMPEGAYFIAYDSPGMGTVPIFKKGKRFFAIELSQELGIDGFDPTAKLYGPYL